VHVITFYSFKGGVGRTLALVNVAVELANHGKTVLLVDFDLEAPGIDTFAELRSRQPSLGVVDYVRSYLRNGKPPDIKSHVYRAPLALREGGAIWVMPAGRRDAEYGARLAEIDWQKLYGQHEGFLMMEDLKLRWQEEFAPDYVLIDSRTGHTEVGGICTRQLPDTVALFFIPNEQNLAGLTGIVQAIRGEENSPGGRKINLEFVASNVPALDDEEEILKSMIRKFSKSLDFERPHTIERYDSLHLLNQAIFVSTRPRSRLSRQYRRLMQTLIEHNLEDRDAALRILYRLSQVRSSRFYSEVGTSRSRTDALALVQRILSHHQEDSEILWATGLIYREQGKLAESFSLLEKAAKLASQRNERHTEQYLLDAVEVQVSLGDFNESEIHTRLSECLQGPGLGVPQLRRLIAVARRAGIAPMPDFSAQPALRNLSPEECSEVAEATMFDRGWQAIGFSLLTSNGVVDLKRDKLSAAVVNTSVLMAIGQKQFALAKDLLSRTPIFDSGREIADIFNFACADWAETGTPNKDLFRRAVELSGSVSRKTANHFQCLALASFLSGDEALSGQHLRMSRQLATELPVSQFSCWSYLERTQEQFLDELKMLERFLKHEVISPAFF
jgi:MinD-like ATPase involved in chromosome partitioning or flagellar assembly